MKQLKLTRKEYKQIKKMDHNDMQKFIVNMYMEGYKTGLSSSATVTPEQIEKIITDTKGVGEIKKKAIMEKITMLFETQERENGSL